MSLNERERESKKETAKNKRGEKPERSQPCLSGMTACDFSLTSRTLRGQRLRGGSGPVTADWPNTGARLRAAGALNFSPGDRTARGHSHEGRWGKKFIC